jgi:hypothetical protein
MPTRRTPIEHARRPRFVPSDEMIAVYREMRTLKCTCEPRPADMPYWDAPEECPTCERFSELNHKLLRLMPNLPPYEVYAAGPRLSPEEGEGTAARARAGACPARGKAVVSPEPPLIEVFAQGTRIGFVLDRNLRGYEAFDSQERPIGIFTCRRAAVRALRAEADVTE